MLPLRIRGYLSIASREISPEAYSFSKALRSSFVILRFINPFLICPRGEGPEGGRLRASTSEYDEAIDEKSSRECRRSTTALSRGKREILSSGDYSASVDDFNDPANWSTSCTTETAIDILEPLPDVDNPYREKALCCMALLKAVDDFMTASQDPRLAWVGISTTLNLESTRGLAPAELARQMGCSTRALSNSRARFRKLSGLDPSIGRSVPWL